jgi:hypothetical protein
MNSDVIYDGTDYVVVNTAPTGAIMRNYIQGAIFSTAGSSATFSVTAGQAADSTNAIYLNLAAISKTTSAWAVGSGNGGLDTGAIANNTWYTPYIIRRPDTGVVDLIFSTNTTSPTLPANYTQYRKLEGMPLLTNASAQWTKFIHVDNDVMWDSPPLDVNGAGTIGNSTNYTLTVPLGAKVKANVNAGASAAGGILVHLRSPEVADLAPSSTAAPLATVGIDSSGVRFIQNQIMTNTSGQIAARVNSATTIRISTLGYSTDRGRNA